MDYSKLTRIIDGLVDDSQIKEAIINKLCSVHLEDVAEVKNVEYSDGDVTVSIYRDYDDDYDGQTSYEQFYNARGIEEVQHFADDPDEKIAQVVVNCCKDFGVVPSSITICVNE